MRDLLVLDGFMQLGVERPYVGMRVQVDEWDGVITDVDEEERLVFVDVDEHDYIMLFSY